MKKEDVEHLIKEQYMMAKEEPMPSLGISVGLKDKDYFKWLVSIFAPDDSIYKGQLFNLSIDFNEDYPLIRPRVKFVTKIYHCNVSDEGDINIPSLQNWNENISMNQVLSDIFSLLYEQNTNNAFDIEIANEYNNNRNQFEKKAQKLEKF